LILVNRIWTTAIPVPFRIEVHNYFAGSGTNSVLQKYVSGIWSNVTGSTNQVSRLITDAGEYRLFVQGVDYFYFTAKSTTPTTSTITFDGNGGQLTRAMVSDRLVEVGLPPLPASVGTAYPNPFYANIVNTTSIGNDAFSNCIGLEKVKIPTMTTSIGNNVFQGCTGLLKISCHSTIPPTTGISSFYGTHPDRILYVMPSSLSNYQNNSNWSVAFPDIQAMKPQRLEVNTP